METAENWHKTRLSVEPFLFILTMHVMFEDIKDRLQDPHQRKTFQGINFHELLYADDTLLVARSTILAKKILHLVEGGSDFLT